MSPRNEEQNALIKDERREQILSAALKVFATRGFAATKISDIVSAGGMSHGLVYHYFKSKEDIFFELVSRAIYYAGQSLVMVDEMPLSPLEKVRQTAKYILSGIDMGQETSYYFLIVVHASVMESTPEEKAKYLKGSEVPMMTLAKILNQGQQEGTVKPGDTFEFAMLFFSAILGLAVYKLTMTDFRMPDPEMLVAMVTK